MTLSPQRARKGNGSNAARDLDTLTANELMI
jgi:hypothetical protein